MITNNNYLLISVFKCYFSPPIVNWRIVISTRKIQISPESVATLVRTRLRRLHCLWWMSQSEKFVDRFLIRWRKTNQNWLNCHGTSEKITQSPNRLCFGNWRHRAKAYGLHGQIRHLGPRITIHRFRRISRSCRKTVRKNQRVLFRVKLLQDSRGAAFVYDLQPPLILVRFTSNFLCMCSTIGAYGQEVWGKSDKD